MDYTLNTMRGFPSQLQHVKKTGFYITDFLSTEPAIVGQTFQIGNGIYLINEVEHRLSPFEYGVRHAVLWNRVKSTLINGLNT